MALYDDIVDITKPYFGLGTRRFIERQLKFHLDIEPEMLKQRHIEELAKWCYMSGKLYLQDEKIAKEFSEKILTLKK